MQPAIFAKHYIKAKLRGLPVEEIAASMGICLKTMYTYMGKPEFKAALGNIEDMTTSFEMEEVADQGAELIKKAYELHLLGIEEAIEEGDFKKARKIAIDGLKICKTDADTKRVFLAIGEVNITHIQHNPQYVQMLTHDREEIMSELMDVVREVADIDTYQKILTRLGQTPQIEHDDDVIDVEGTEEESVAETDKI